MRDCHDDDYAGRGVCGTSNTTIRLQISMFHWSKLNLIPNMVKNDVKSLLPSFT